MIFDRLIHREDLTIAHERVDFNPELVSHSDDWAHYLVRFFVGGDLALEKYFSFMPASFSPDADDAGLMLDLLETDIDLALAAGSPERFCELAGYEFAADDADYWNARFQGLLITKAEFDAQFPPISANENGDLSSEQNGAGVVSESFSPSL